MRAERITDEQWREVARLRFQELLDWQDVADQVGCSRQAIWAFRKDYPDEWIAHVDEITQEMRADAVPTAWGALSTAARRKYDTAAAKEMLDRLEGAVAQKHEIKADVTHALEEMSVEELIEAASDNGQHQPGGSEEGASEEGAPSDEDE